MPILPLPLVYHLLVLSGFAGTYAGCDYAIKKITKPELVQQYQAKQVKGK